ncbi:MAG: hypothetical protein AAFQ36_09500 [Pseudomonadota bacterium]
MSDTELSIFEDEPATPQEQVAPETAETAPEVAEVETPPTEPKASETGEPEAAPPAAEVKEEPHSVPITAMLDEREKRQETQRQLEQERQARERLEAHFRQQQLEAQKQEAPDWYENPQAALSHHMQQQQVQEHNRFLNQSQFFAEREYGKELIAEAQAWIAEDPRRGQQFMDHPSPWHAVAEAFKAQKAVQQIGPDPEAWMREKEAELRQSIMAEMQSQTPAPPVAPKMPPASLSSAPASGGDPNETAVSVPKHLTGLFG